MGPLPGFGPVAQAARGGSAGVPMIKWYGPAIYFRFRLLALLPRRIRKAIYIQC